MSNIKDMYYIVISRSMEFTFGTLVALVHSNMCTPQLIESCCHATFVTLLFEGLWSSYLGSVLVVPVEFVAMEIMLPWQQRNTSMTVLPDGLHSCFHQKLCQDNRLWGVLFVYYLQADKQVFRKKMLLLYHSLSESNKQQNLQLFEQIHRAIKVMKLSSVRD